MNKTGVIYGLSCACHPERGIRYVGQTVRSAEWRLRVHRSTARSGGITTPLYSWMRKHGPENVTTRVLAESIDLDADEMRWVSRLRSETSTLLNVRDGGNSGGSYGPMTQDRRDKISRALTGIRRSDSSKRLRADTIRRQGTFRGEGNGRAVISAADAISAYHAVRVQGLKIAEVARRMGVSWGVVSNISKKRTWAHLTDALDGEWQIG